MVMEVYNERQAIGQGPPKGQRPVRNPRVKVRGTLGMKSFVELKTAFFGMTKDMKELKKFNYLNVKQKSHFFKYRVWRDSLDVRKIFEGLTIGIFGAIL